jgi:UDP-N-acetylmuramoylalanine--D-glutamate ligase
MPLAFLIGGLSKAGSWEPLLKECRTIGGALLPVLCFGKDGPLLGSHCRAAGLAYQVVPTLEDAVRHGLAAIQAGGVLLLSPGCASFDQFTDFEHRGAVFKRCVAGELPAADQ